MHGPKNLGPARPWIPNFRPGWPEVGCGPGPTRPEKARTKKFLEIFRKILNILIKAVALTNLFSLQLKLQFSY